MAKPVLLTVDDDAEVLRAVERDLRRDLRSLVGSGLLTASLDVGAPRLAAEEIRRDLHGVVGGGVVRCWGSNGHGESGRPVSGPVLDAEVVRP